MSLSLQLLDYKQGYMYLHEDPFKEISSDEKVFKLKDELNKKVTHLDGSVSHSKIEYLLLEKTDKVGIYNVKTYCPEKKAILGEFGLACLYKDQSLFDF